jgi:hypothetical protein
VPPTEWQQLADIVRVLEARRRALDELIELTRMRMETAQGRPS